MMHEQKWYDKYITEDDGGFIAWDEKRYDSIGYFATRREAIKAVVEYSRKFNREDRLNVETK
jgi:hypothetical protein